MKVAISSTDNHLEAPVSPVFGRCPYFVLVDSETMQFTALPNPAVGASGGAGIQAAQYVIQQGAEAVASGNVGPNALQVLLAAGIAVYAVESGTVREAMEALKAGQLPLVSQPTVSSDFGKGGAGPGLGQGGRGRGMGRSGGGGMGRGAGGARR